jgi:hypothetical protein
MEAMNNDPYKVMIDLEGLDLDATAEILSIGACWWPSGSLGSVADLLENSFYVNVDQVSYRDYRESRWFTAACDTVEWWSNVAPQAARDALRSDQKAITVALDMLSAALPRNIEEIFCKGASYDLAILRHHSRKLDWKLPYSYRAEACYRTLLNRPNAHLYVPEGSLDFASLVPHRADHDAVRQAWTLQRLLRGMGG